MMGVKQTMKVDETETSSQLYLFSAVSQLPVVRSEHARKPFDSTPSWESKSEDSTSKVSPQKTGISLQGSFYGVVWPQIKKLNENIFISAVTSAFYNLLFIPIKKIRILYQIWIPENL